MPFPFDHRYPGTDLHEIDLGYIIEQIKIIKQELKNFADVNKLNYANPLDWNITTVYSSFTIVRNPADGTLYISMQPVPAGIQITDPDYWQLIGVYTGDSGNFREAICANDEGTSATASREYLPGECYWRNDDLYRIRQHINAGTAFNSANSEEIHIATQLIDGLQRSTPERVYMFLGDSYGANNGNETGVQSHFSTIMGLNTRHFYGNSQNSTSFTQRYSDQGDPYPTYLGNLQAYSGARFLKTDVTDIIVETAGNDYIRLQKYTNANYPNIEDSYAQDRATAKGELTTAIQTFVSYCRANYPNANIYVAFPVWAQAFSTRSLKYDCMQDMKDIVEDMPGITWIENMDISLKLMNLDRNTSHPNGTGNLYIARAIKSALLTGSVSITEPHGVRSTFLESNTEDITAWNTVGFQSFQLKDTVYVRSTGKQLFKCDTSLAKFTIPAVGSYGSNYEWHVRIDLGEMSNARFHGQPITTVDFPVTTAKVRLSSYDGHNAVWRQCDSAFLRFTTKARAQNTINAQLDIYMNNPGGPEQASDIQVQYVQFDIEDWYIPACYV